MVAQADVKMLGFTVESLVIEFDQEKLNSPKASGVSRGDNVARTMIHGQDDNKE